MSSPQQSMETHTSHTNHAAEKLAALVAQMSMPLTEMIRPKSFGQYIGQEHLLNSLDGEISNYLRLGYLPSMVLCGPPGVGKTSLARLLADEASYVFVEFSATLSTLADLKELLDALVAENHKRCRQHTPRLRVLVFIDEIHRFSTVQQDYLLPYIEKGTFVFVGATTTDPLKSVRRAILSRCHLFKLEALADRHIEQGIYRAILHENIRRRVLRKLSTLVFSRPAVIAVVRYASGDMRSAVSLIEILGSRYKSISEVPADSGLETARAGEILIDEGVVSSAVKALNKTRFGLQSEENLPLLAHLLRSLRYPQSHQVSDSLETDMQIQASSTIEEQDSDLESWFDEREQTKVNSIDPKLKAWGQRLYYSDDDIAEPGPLYSDEEQDFPFDLKKLSRHSASKFRILSATHACLKLLKNGESALSILKYLIMFTCTHTCPENNELVKVVSVLKAMRKAGVGFEPLLLNCIERLAGNCLHETKLLRESLEAASIYCLQNMDVEVHCDNKGKPEYKILYNDELVDKLLREESHVEEEDACFGMPVISSEHLGSEFTCGEN